MKQIIIKMGLLAMLLDLLGCKNTPTVQPNAENVDIQSINPNDILFTLPTIENALPEFETKNNQNNLHFHEDDWRQVEFVSKKQKALIDSEIAKIKDIYDNYSIIGEAFTSFKKISVRESITQHLGTDLNVVTSYFDNKDFIIKGLSLDNNEGQVKNGFSFLTNGIQYYGQTDNNQKIKWLGILSTENIERFRSSIPSLSKLLRRAATILS